MAASISIDSSQKQHEFGYYDILMAQATNNHPSGPQDLNNTEATTSSSLQQPNEYTNGHYDMKLTAEPVYGGNDASYVGRNLQKISYSNTTAATATHHVFDNHDTLLICHVPTMLRYSSPSNSKSKADFSGGSLASGDVVGGGDLGAIAYAASAGILLAFQHANNGNGVVAPALEGLNEWCPVRFTSEMLDKGGTGLDAVTALAELVTRSPEVVNDDSSQQQQLQQQPCSIIGAHVSDASSKLASLAAVFDLPVVSSSAMSTTLDDLEQYPTFLRTHTDVGGFGEMSVSFLMNKLGIRKFGLLFTNDGYGYGFARSVLEAASERGAEVVGGGVPYIAMSSKENADDELRAAMKLLAESGCNYFVGNFYAESFAKVMTIATEFGLIGDGKFWLISGTADMAPFVLGGALKVNQVVGKAIEGNGIYFCEGGVPGLGGTYDIFTREWKEMGEDEQALSYINSKQPLKEDGTQYAYPPEFFQMRPHHVVTFSYDAGVGLALSACEAWKDATTAAAEGAEGGLDTLAAFNGSAHYAAFANSTYIGASGHIKFRETFPTRTAESSYFVMANLRAVPMDDNSTLVRFKGSPVIDYYDTLTSTWQQLPGKEFIYSGGSSVPPVEMVPVNQNIGAAAIVAIVLAVVLVAVISVGMLLRKRRKQNEISWEINPADLKFDEPPVVIGRGTFGLVLLAEYRGTTVAVKRVLPPRSVAQGQRHGSSSGGKQRRVGSLDDDSNKFDLESGLSSGEGQSKSRRKGKVAFSNDAANNIHEGIEWLENKNGDNTNKNVSNNSVDFNPGVLSGTSVSGTMSGGSTTATKRRVNKILTSIGIGKEDDGYEKLKRQFINEMRLLSTLRHPNICTVMGNVTLGSEPMLIMEYMQMGSLFSLLHNETVPLSGELILPILQDVTKGLRFLHNASPPVVHSDLKSANILVDSRLHAKVADFGLSQKKEFGAAGTPYWMAPELLRKESDNTPASDVYSFGIILFEAYTRKVPYDGEDFDDVIKQVADKSIQKRPPLPKSAPPQITSMMTECLADNPNERPIFDELDVRLKRLTVESADVTDTIRSHRHSGASQLLYDNFPKKVADALREGRKVQPEMRECVSIFFSDIVGFTDISSKLSPMKVSDMLDRLYSSFDELSRAHDIFKIETIGDAYMAVTNLVKDQDDHAKRVVDFAVEALTAANETLIDVDDPSRGCVNIRVGLHSGAVVANVVGSRNLKYSIFGDSVNVAARMEQNSRVNRIHCSESTAKILHLQDPSRSIKPRGTINVKGKDLPMETFWINEKPANVEKSGVDWLCI
eukprot:scaffold2027_cov148-Skeletonema_marinoi.AAC.17